MSLEEAKSTQKLNTLKPIYCPHTGKRLVAESYQQFAIPNGQVTWFHCEACRGWHIVIDNSDAREPRLTPDDFKGLGNRSGQK